MPPAKQTAEQGSAGTSPVGKAKSPDKSGGASSKLFQNWRRRPPRPPNRSESSPKGPKNGANERRTDEQKGMIANERSRIIDRRAAQARAARSSQGAEGRYIADTPKGLYEERTKPKTQELLGERGGTIQSQQAVEDGLNWLARHQGEDGHWGADCLGMAPNSRCDQNAPCQGTGEAYEIAQTGLALLAFQAAGHYYFNGQKYSDQVKKGLDYFIQEQASDGSIVGSQNPSEEQISAGFDFNISSCTSTPWERSPCARPAPWRSPKERSPTHDIRQRPNARWHSSKKLQHDDGGWRYTTNARDRSDCSVSGWAMLALKTAREANISVSPQTISRMLGFFAANYADGRTSYGADPNHPSDAMTGVGMMAVEFFEHKLDSPIVKEGAVYLADKADALTQPLPGFARDQMLKPFQPPIIAAFPASLAQNINYYLWYNCSMAMFQVGGKPWERWNGAVRDRVIGLQVHGEGCDRGSWPPDDQYGGAGRPHLFHRAGGADSRSLLSLSAHRRPAGKGEVLREVTPAC